MQQIFYTYSSWGNNVLHEGLGPAFEHMIRRKNMWFTFGINAEDHYYISTYTPESLFKHQIFIWKDMVRQGQIFNWGDVEYFLEKDVFQYHLANMLVIENPEINVVNLFFSTNTNNTGFYYQKVQYHNQFLEEIPWMLEGF